jgi:NADPH-dependent 2,4-dienoyl-CoA reductase/sulfur reductase-like enzyme
MINPKRIIVVGGNAAGPAAAAKAKRVNPNANILLFEESNFISTGTCEMPYVVSGKISSYEDILSFSPNRFMDEKGVQVFIKHKVEKIDRRTRTIYVHDLVSEKNLDFNYDSLILTTGSLPKTIPGFSKELKNVFHLKNISDLIHLQEYLNSVRVKKAVIIGSGYIGIETAEALVKCGIDITIIEKEALPFPSSEKEISECVLIELQKNSVQFLNEIKQIEPIITDNSIIGIKVNGKELSCDLVLLTVGVVPNNILAEKSKLELGKFGGIKVDKKLRTSDTNIFAAGDNIEFINAVTRNYDYFPFATYAHNFGHIAGANAAGKVINADPIIKNVSVKVFGSYTASVGLSSKQAENFNLNYKIVDAEVPNLVKVMPESRNVYGKIIFHKENKKILGASFCGGKEVSGYADLIASLIFSGQTIEFLTKIPYNYTPPLSPFVNLLSILGRRALKN